MDQYFKELPIKIDMLDVTKLELTPRREFNGRVFYSNIHNVEYTNYLSNIFKELSPRTISYSEFDRGNPHIDHDSVKCGINHYYITQDVETVFYEPKSLDVKSFPGQGEEASNFFDKKDLIIAGKFFSQPNSVWLLDVTKIHSLEFPNPLNSWDKVGPKRTFVKWAFDEPYEVIYQKLFNEVIPRLNANQN
jgi:hypothetical protein